MDLNPLTYKLQPAMLQNVSGLKSNDTKFQVAVLLYLTLESLAVFPRRRMGTDGGKSKQLVPGLPHTAVNQDTHMLGACHASLFPCSTMPAKCRKCNANVATDASLFCRVAHSCQLWFERLALSK